MIQQYSFGRMKVAGREYVNDLKIIHGRVIENWRRKEGHLLNIADVEDILTARPAILVAGTGYSGQMRVRETLQPRLAEYQIKLIAQPTTEATNTFNHLIAEGKNVAGVFHLTC